MWACVVSVVNLILGAVSFLLCVSCGVAYLRGLVSYLPGLASGIGPVLGLGGLRRGPQRVRAPEWRLPGMTRTGIGVPAV